MRSQRLQIAGVGKRQRCTVNRQKVRGVIRIARLLLGADRGNQRLVLIEGEHPRAAPPGQNNGAPVQRCLKVKTLAGLQLAFFNQQVCALINPVREDPAGGSMRSPFAEYQMSARGLLAAELLKEAVQSYRHGCATGERVTMGFHSTATGGGGRGECARC